MPCMRARPSLNYDILTGIKSHNTKLDISSVMNLWLCYVLNEEPFRIGVSDTTLRNGLFSHLTTHRSLCTEFDLSGDCVEELFSDKTTPTLAVIQVVCQALLALMYSTINAVPHYSRQ